jgi:hypothetical protein
MKNLQGDVVSRKFEYTKNEKPTIVSYLYGSVKIVRPITLISKNGNILERFEIAHKTFCDKPLTENMIKHGDIDKLQGILDFIVSDEEFNSLDRYISKDIH